MKKEHEKSLEHSISDGAAFSVMEAFTTNFITPFALSMQAGTTFISIIATLPALIASFGQLIVNTLLKISSRRKLWIVVGALLQAISWIPLAIIPFWAGDDKLLWLFLLVTANAFFLAVINPIWTSLMGDLVPADSRGSYFGKRTSITGLVSFIAMLVAGFTLNALSGSINAFVAFGVLFLIAFVARMVSAYYLWQMHEPQFRIGRTEEFSLLDFVGRLRSSDYGKFVMYLCLLGFAVNIASPFFSVYMLKNLGFSYMQFTLITASSVVSSFLTIVMWGKLSDRFGNKRIMILTGVLVPLVPIMWLFFTDVWHLILVEIVSGAIWAGFNLTSGNYVYDATSPQKRPRCIAYLNVLRGSAVFVGAILGGFLVKHLPSFGLQTPILVVFIISGVLRLAVSLSFFKKLREARLLEVVLHHSSHYGTIIICPRQGMSYHHPMVLVDHEKQDHEHVHVRHDPVKTGLPHPAPVRRSSEQKKLLGQYFRLSNVPIQLEKAKLKLGNSFQRFRR
jgi:MFS family permease